MMGETSDPIHAKTLNVYVYSARNLLQFGKKEMPPNTYCKIKIAKELYGTDVSLGSFSPKWDTVATFSDIGRYFAKKKHLSITVLTSKKKFIGKIRISLNTLVNEPEQDRWFPLLDKKLQKNPRISGEIHVVLQYRGPKFIPNDEPIPPDDMAMVKPPKEEPKKVEKTPLKNQEKLIDFTKVYEKEKNELFGSHAAAEKKEYNNPLPEDRPFDENSTESILLETQRVTEDSKKSIQRSLGILDNTKSTAVETAVKLEQQGKQLENISGELDRMDAQLDIGQRYIRGIKSMFGNVAKRKDKEAQKKINAMSAEMGNPLERRQRGKATKEVRERNMLSQQQQQRKELIPNQMVTLERKDSLDEGLDEIEERVRDLKQIAINFGSELAQQEETIDRVNPQVDKNFAKIQKERAEIRKLK